MTRASGNRFSQATLDWVRSILVLIKEVGFLQLVQVNIFPVKPRSIRLALSRKSKKGCILDLQGGLLPNFSFGLAMSLKSPIRSHGRFM